MPVYAKKVSTSDPRFSGRINTIMGINDNKVSLSRIPIPDNVVLCNGCNQNLHPDPGYGYLVYLGKRELSADHPYDIYCESCLKRYFKGYKEVQCGATKSQ